MRSKSMERSHRNAYDVESAGSTDSESQPPQRWPGRRSKSSTLRGPNAELQAAIRAITAGGGTALPANVQRELGPLLGHDLGDVRVHSGGDVARTAGSLGAAAFTHGNQIGLGSGIDLESASGRHVLAHELVHVVQAARGGGSDLAAFAEVGPSGSTIEREAEAGAAAITGGTAFHVAAHARMPGLSLLATTELSARVDQMADPKAKERYTTIAGGVDGMRLQAMQFGYTSNSLYRSIIQSFVPTEALSEHAGQVTGNTIYNRGVFVPTPTGLPIFNLEGLQGKIEQIRGLVRIVGDLAGAIGAWSGLLGIIGDLILAISAATGPGVVIGAAIKKIVDAIGTIPFLVKAVTDALDAVIGVLQLLILYLRAKSTTDPAERARIAQQMKKESSDLVSALSSLVMSAVSAAASALISASINTVATTSTTAVKNAMKTKGIGNAAGKIAQNGWQQTKAAFKATVWTMPSFGKTTRIYKQEMDAQLRPFKIVHLRHKIQSRQLGIGSVPVAAVQRIIANPSTKLAYVTALANHTRTITNNINAFNIGTVTAASQADTKSRSQTPTDGTTPTKSGALDGPASRPQTPAQDRMEIDHVSMWPSKLAELKGLQATLAPAKLKVLESYKSAKQDLDPALAQEFEAKFGRVTQINGRLRSEALRQRLVAEQQKAAADNEQPNATQATTKSTQAVTEQGNLQQTGDTVRSASSELKPVEAPAPEPDQEGGVWNTIAKSNPIKRGVDWAYDNTVGKLVSGVNQKIADAQGYATNWVSKLVLSEFTKEELDMAGIGDELRSDAQKETENQQKSTETDTATTKIEADLAKLKETRTTTEQRALEGAQAAMQFLEDLDDADAAITGVIAKGETYVAEVIAQLQQQQQTETDGKPIDATYLAPITSGLANARASVTGIEGDLKSEAIAALDRKAAEFATVGSEAWSTIRGACIGKLDQAVGLYSKQVGVATGAFDELGGQATALIGTIDNAAAKALSAHAEEVGNQQLEALEAIELKVGDLVATAVAGMDQCVVSAVKETEATQPKQEEQS
ncbi:MAG: DUF4157 domain-containing protein [Kofleriaceae bacterium]